MRLYSILKNWFYKIGIREVEFASPPSPTLGELSTPVAFKIAKERGFPPLECAKDLRKRLLKNKPSVVEKINVTAPGYLNLVFDHRELSRLLKKKHFTLKTIFKDKIVIEHTSVNPNKALHIGHVRNAVLGDSLARLLRRTGHNVEVQNYIDDTGVQVADVILGLNYYQAQPEKGERFDYLTWRIYAQIQKELEEKPKLVELRRQIVADLEKRKGRFAREGERLANRILNFQLKSLARLGIYFDALVWESSLLEEKIWNATFALLKERGVIKLEESGPNKGAWIIPFGGIIEVEAEKVLSADKVLVKSNGEITYLAKDIAYHLSSAKFARIPIPLRYRLIPHPGARGLKLWTTKRGREIAPLGRAQRCYTVIDFRQSYLQNLLREALKRLGYADLARETIHIGYEVVSLSSKTALFLGFSSKENQKSVAMSGREGIGIKADEFFERLLSEIEKKGSIRKSAELLTRAVIRYQMLKPSPLTPIIFDLEEATKTIGETGIYLCYSYVRARSILRRFTRINFAYLAIPTEIATSEKELIFKLLSWPQILEVATEHLNLSLITNFAYELCVVFNRFYEDPLLGRIREEPDRKKKRFRLFLVKSFLEVLRDALDILGIEPPARI